MVKYRNLRERFTKRMLNKNEFNVHKSRTKRWYSLARVHVVVDHYFNAQKKRDYVKNIS